MSNYAAIPHAHITCQIIQPRLMRIQLPYYAIIGLGCSGEVVPDPHMAPIVLLLLQTGDKSCSIQGVTQVATFNYNYKVFSLF
jgi:hypothetical protein